MYILAPLMEKNVLVGGLSFSRFTRRFHRMGMGFDTEHRRQELQKTRMITTRRFAMHKSDTADSYMSLSETELKPLHTSLIDSFLLMMYEPRAQCYSSSSVNMVFDLFHIQNRADFEAINVPHRNSWYGAESSQSTPIRMTGRWVQDTQNEGIVHIHVTCPFIGGPTPSNHICSCTNMAGGKHMACILDILSRVMLQLLLNGIHKKTHLNANSIHSIYFQTFTVGMDHKNSIISPTNYSIIQLKQEGGFPSLFSSLLDPKYFLQSIEMSNMVDTSGNVMAYIPRVLIHRFNILHNGVGILVWRPTIHEVQHTTTITTSSNSNSSNTISISSYDIQDIEIYLHKRTSTKRIFPSLYDMFVGGVCTIRESVQTTATRELEEELNLKHCQEFLSPPLFTCLISTTYNRCVVTVFTYSYHSKYDTIQWQPEEVDWGDFIPYSVVQQSATLSMERMKLLETTTGARKTIEEETPRMSLDDKNQAYYSSSHWDFVPDGLLVWESWLDYVQKCKR